MARKFYSDSVLLFIWHRSDIDKSTQRDAEVLDDFFSLFGIFNSHEN